MHQLAHSDCRHSSRSHRKACRENRCTSWQHDQRLFWSNCHGKHTLFLTPFLNTIYQHVILYTISWSYIWPSCLRSMINIFVILTGSAILVAVTFAVMLATHVLQCELVALWWSASFFETVISCFQHNTSIFRVSKPVLGQSIVMYGLPWCESWSRSTRNTTLPFEPKFMHARNKGMSSLCQIMQHGRYKSHIRNIVMSLSITS